MRKKKTSTRKSAVSLSHARFVELMDSERLLQQAIAGLLTRLPRIQNVQILHGAQEAGKDVVFDTTGPLGEVLPCACVIKNHEISGDVSTNQGARSVLHQVEQALDTPYFDGTGNEILVQRVYVITPYPIKPTTINSVIGSLRRRAGQVVFFDGCRLFRLLLDYWPDFLADEAVAIDAYLRASSRRLEQNPELERVATLYDLASDGKPLPAMYVELDLSVRWHKLDYKRFLTKKRLSLGEIYALAGASKAKLPERRQTIEDKLISIFAFASYLAECNYWDREAAPLGDDFPRPAQFMMSQLGSTPGEIKSDRRALIDEAILELDTWIEKGVRPLELSIAKQTDTIARLKDAPKSLTNMFSSETFRTAFMVDNCLSSAPWKRDEAEPTLESPYPPQAILSSELQAVLIVGPAGSGKTSFCRWNALRDAKSYLNGESDVVPVYVPLQIIQNEQLSGLKDLIISAASRSALIDVSVERLLGGSEFKVRVYLDGLDEVFLDEKRKQFALLSAHALEQFKNLQIIITSRDYVSGVWLNWLPRVYLETLKPNDVRRLARIWLGGDADAVERFIREMSVLLKKGEFSWTPLLATLTILVYRQTSKLPENRTRLYELFTDLLCGGWDLAKGILRQSLFERDTKLRLLSHIAFSIHSRGSRYFGIRQIAEAIEWSLGNDKRVGADKLLAELVRDTIIVGSGNEFQFRHLSFQEFFAARFCLRQPNGDQIQGAIKSYIDGNDWWREVVRFYIGLCGRSKDLLGWINSLDPGRRVEALYSFLDEAL